MYKVLLARACELIFHVLTNCMNCLRLCSALLQFSSRLQVGRGVLQDPARAAELWKSAAAAGLPECLFVLGNRLCRPDGGGGVSSATIASSSAVGTVSSAGNSGASSLALPGVPVEGLSKAQKKRAKEKAKKLAAAAAAASGSGNSSSSNGSSNSSSNRNTAGAAAAAAQAKAAREAVALFACAAGAGLAPAQFNVANCLEHGIGISRHRAAAEAW